MIGLLYFTFPGLFIHMTRGQVIFLFGLSLCFDVWIHIAERMAKGDNDNATQRL